MRKPFLAFDIPVRYNVNMEQLVSANHQNLWQNPLWATFQQSIGRKVWMLDVEGGQALVIWHPLPFNLCWLEVPRGPLFENEDSMQKILQEIKVLGKKEGAVFIRMSPYKLLTASRLPLTATSSDHHPQTSLLIDLTQAEDDILKQMKPKGRYNIKIARKHEIDVKVSQDVTSFHSILEKTGGRDGFGIHPKSYYEKMLKALGDKAQLLLASHQGKVIAGGIFVYVDDMAIYYYGASDHAYRKFMAPYLIQWQAIVEGKKRGCKHYDFLGIAPEGAKNHAWAGVTSFKKKFGGQVVDYPQAQEMVLRPFWYWVYRMRKKLG